MWANESVFYQIYPLGLCGAPIENDEKQAHRILTVKNWIPHLKKMGIHAVYFSPLFSSDTHGYNTRDFERVDERLGTKEDMQEVSKALHQADIRIVLDGVFNHVGRGFWAFQDVLQKREYSKYLNWFHINLEGDSHYQDGLWYEGWEGNYDLVKLNLQNEEVVQHLLTHVRGWIEDYDIDGLRLDVAYCLDHTFIRRLRSKCDEWKKEFFLVGEMLHGDYNQLMNSEMLHSVTNYECYKGLYSSFNSMNMFEIIHSLLRQFGPEDWTLYKGAHMLSFVDNHDVTRVASILQNKKHIPLIYTLLLGMPGIPCIYYGSEWGIYGEKKEGDVALRPSIDVPHWNELTDHIAKLIAIKTNSSALNYGEFQTVLLTNRQCIFERKKEEECIWVVINADGEDFLFRPEREFEKAEDLLTGELIQPSKELTLQAYSSGVWRLIDKR